MRNKISVNPPSNFMFRILTVLIITYMTNGMIALTNKTLNYTLTVYLTGDIILLIFRVIRSKSLV